jgi:hypothetical protein
MTQPKRIEFYTSTRVDEVAVYPLGWGQIFGAPEPE